MWWNLLDSLTWMMCAWSVSCLLTSLHAQHKKIRMHSFIFHAHSKRVGSWIAQNERTKSHWNICCVDSKDMLWMWWWSNLYEKSKHKMFSCILNQRSVCVSSSSIKISARKIEFSRSTRVPTPRRTHIHINCKRLGRAFIVLELR